MIKIQWFYAKFQEEWKVEERYGRTRGYDQKVLN